MTPAMLVITACALTGDVRRCKRAYFVWFGWLVCTCSKKTVRSWT